MATTRRTTGKGRRRTATVEQMSVEEGRAEFQLRCKEDGRETGGDCKEMDGRER